MTTTSIKKAIGEHFFSKLHNPNNDSTLSRSQLKAEQSVQEVEELFQDENQFELEEEDESHSAFGSFRRKASRNLKPSIYVHTSIAMALNVLTILTATPFKVLPKNFFFLFLLLSLLSAYRFLYNYKSYHLFEFESLYPFLKKKSSLQQNELIHRKQEDKHGYYTVIIRYLAETFPGVHFEYKMQKRIQGDN